MYFLYSFLLTLAVFLLSPLFILRRGKYTEGLAQRLGNLPPFDAGGKRVLWLHCVSVGETQAARPLAQALLEAYPNYALVVSTTTKTGQSLAREVFGAPAAAVFYFPFDWAWTVRRALRRVNPSAVLIMETELWPNFLRLCREQNVPVAIVNGRLSEKSVRGYRRVPRFIARVVNDLTLALMQTEADAARLRELGLSRVEVSGNVKFDLAPGRDEHALTDELRARFAFDAARPLIVAASTHAPEERIALEAFQAARREHPSARLLVAPRHPERFAEVAALLANSSLTFARRSAPAQSSDTAADAVLLDTIGELRAVYPLAALVFVGGSLAPAGGHNVLEPALAGACIVTGPHTFNFAAVVQDFLAADALAQVSDADELARVWAALLADDARRRQLAANARAALEQNRGATARTVEMLESILGN
jgi:3-deoxy-D-manno-octulosonic-acid transferase